MKMSNELKSTLASITTQDCYDAWDRKPTTELEKVLDSINTEDWDAVDARKTEIVLDNAIKIWKMYIPIFEKADSFENFEEGLWQIKGSAWSIKSKLADCFYYHKDLPYFCSMLYYYYNLPHTKEMLEKMLECIIAFRNNQVIPLSFEEKEFYKNEYIKFCKKNNFPGIIKKFFGEKGNS
jgi:hypothetical protein